MSTYKQKKKKTTHDRFIYFNNEVSPSTHPISPQNANHKYCMPACKWNSITKKWTFIQNGLVALGKVYIIYINYVLQIVTNKSWSKNDLNMHKDIRKYEISA